eukprot:CAMPEP_0177651328 /NCGR_PEP_ID=MMETSP0447-20121125/12482_1 /TAXON_ID=0 /ORGANISM="Stygamoeba regulata, Strain BSH-02190019" /LENGTH=623 /DNA_ID=CAMNT_0019154387 /DNA_START=56 /DNA_END=1927 /DNA_ORIENTATION=+
MAYTGPILPPVVEKEEKEKPDMGQPHASKPSIPLFMEVEGRLVELVGTLPKRRVKKLQYGEKNIFLAGPDSECSPEAFEDHICAQTISLYPVNKHANTRLGDPICDRFAVQLYENRVIATVADGCNWGPKPRDAAKAASKAFVNYMRSHQNIVREASDACILLLRAISEAHTRVVSGKEETWWECGTTTICGGILLELEEVENDPFNWAFICASVGDCKAFRYSAGSNKITDITRGNRTNLTDAQDCGGRIGPFKNGQPDLRNLNFYYQNCRVGDMILIVSDGVHDNLDPMNFGLPPSTAAPGILGKDSYSDWDTLNDDQIEEIKAQYMRRKVEVDLLGKEMQTPSVMVERLLDHAKQSTHASRTFMEENPEKKQPHDYILYPGKMDHTTCVCFRVGPVKFRDRPAYKNIHSTLQSVFDHMKMPPPQGIHLQSANNEFFFTGQDAITWMQNHYPHLGNREGAENFFQQLMDQGFIHTVLPTYNGQFTDDNATFKFILDGGDRIKVARAAELLGLVLDLQEPDVSVSSAAMLEPLSARGSPPSTPTLARQPSIGRSWNPARTSSRVQQADVVLDLQGYNPNPTAAEKLDFLGTRPRSKSGTGGLLNEEAAKQLRREAEKLIAKE